MGLTELSEETMVIVKIMVPFLGPHYNRHLIFRVPQKGSIILTTTHKLRVREYSLPS